jgi:hypothetical protein
MLDWLSAAAGCAFILLAVLVWAALKDESKAYCLFGVSVFVFWGSYIFTMSIGLMDAYEPLTALALYVSVAWLIAHFGKLIVERNV